MGWRFPPLVRGQVQGTGSLIEIEIWCGDVIGEDPFQV